MGIHIRSNLLLTFKLIINRQGLGLPYFIEYKQFNSLARWKHTTIVSPNINVAATRDGSNFVMICWWVFVIIAPGHQGSNLKCMLFSGGYLFCEFPVCVLHRMSARIFVPGAGFWTGWTWLLCEVGIKFNLCVILAHSDNFGYFCQYIVSLTYMAMYL